MRTEQAMDYLMFPSTESRKKLSIISNQTYVIIYLLLSTVRIKPSSHGKTVLNQLSPEHDGSSTTPIPTASL